ncbi:UNVERIFIED_CONTAM: Retrovirus-related Pol polyprotein from transposon TNT 1-94 [Sesamum latifolium]|uniref:Retrovirus-related Pol polyprotein from transposon TNT 1-94 n=1 Tax=Sesamum latifolium TaxID=2727402 RepID=A0AAW2SQW4_9LAMI
MGEIVLDFENEGYVLDKPLPTALPEGSSPEEHLTFDKWHEDNRKVRSIILASMTNEIQKYAATKAFFGIKMAKGSSVQSHGVKMLSLVEKLEDLKAGLNNDTYIDVILQSLPPSYDPFIVDYNMNGLEKSIHELSERQGCQPVKRKKDKGTAITATASTGGAPAAPMGKGKGKVGVSQRSKANDVCMHCQGKGHWKRECPQLLSNPDMFVVEVNMISNSASWVLNTGCGAHICNNLQVLERSRKLSKDEMILRLGDGKAVAAEAVGSLSLVSNLIMTAQHKRKVDNHKTAQIWQARLGHISKDRIKRLVDSKNLEIDDLDQIPTCESCLRGKMIKKPFIDKARLPMYGYVYLMRYKSEAFGRFKGYILEFENQTNRKIKALRSDRGGEYLSGEFIDYLKENGILYQWTPPGTPQLNGVAERRNRTLLDMVRSMMSFMELPLSFLGYALETTAKLLKIVPSKTVPQAPYEIWHGKPASYKYLRVYRISKETMGYYFYDPIEQKIFVSRNAVFLEKDFPSDSQRDEILIEESSEEPQHDSSYSSLRFTRMTYGEAISDVDSDKWLEAMKSKMDSMGSNQVWTLVDPPKGVRPVGYKWVYKRKLGADGEVTAFKARLVVKGYTQRPGVDFEETYSPVAMAKSIRILLAIAACRKVSLLLEKNRKSVVFKGPSTASSKLPEAGTHFDEVIRGYDFIKNDYDPCIYKKISGSSVVYLVLYVDDILLIGNNAKTLGDIKA